MASEIKLVKHNRGCRAGVNNYFSPGATYAGVISMGAQGGGAPLVKIFDHLEGSASLRILALALLFKVN